jgi:hypothetical protein
MLRVEDVAIQSVLWKSPFYYLFSEIHIAFYPYIDPWSLY